MNFRDAIPVIQVDKLGEKRRFRGKVKTFKIKYKYDMAVRKWRSEKGKVEGN